MQQPGHKTRIFYQFLFVFSNYLLVYSLKRVFLKITTRKLSTLRFTITKVWVCRCIFITVSVKLQGVFTPLGPKHLTRGGADQCGNQYSFKEHKSSKPKRPVCVCVCVKNNVRKGIFETGRTDLLILGHLISDGFSFSISQKVPGIIPRFDLNQ